AGHLAGVARERERARSALVERCSAGSGALNRSASLWRRVQDEAVGTVRQGMRVCRVGFRFGTDAELAAMHLVESKIESERRPGGALQPLESYVAFARNLPSQFDDHTWLAETDDRTPVGCSACWSNAAGDPRVMECYVYVREHWRTQGVGWRLARAIL